MSPQIGEPYFPWPGERLSVGDPNAAAGTVAYKGVIVSEAGIPTYIVDSTVPINIKAYFKLAKAGPVAPVPTGFAVQFYVTDINGVGVGGSPFASNPLVTPDPPDGAMSPPDDSVRWWSADVDIGSGLAADTIYRISVDGDDGAGGLGYFAFHDLTVFKTQP